MVDASSLYREQPDVIVAVMGATGTGKSTFIKLLTNDDRIRIGHDQQSETIEIQTASYADPKTRLSVMLIDTPGFDDSRDGVTDTDILQQIVDYLEPANRQGQKLNGIIYLHRISDPRVGGISRKNIRMFRELCGEEKLSNVRVVTTNWDRVHSDEGNHRETDLKNGAFKTLLDCGAQMRRHTNTVDSAQKIMSELIPLPAVTMQIQEELHKGKKLSETAAGMVLNAETRELQRSYERQLADMRREFELAAQANDRALRAELELDRKNMEAKIARLEADRQKLEMRLDELQRDQEDRGMC